MVLTGDDFWKAKVAAFLHDPPDKAGVLFHAGAGGHERVAAAVGKALGLEESDADRFAAIATRADHLASGSDRPPMARAEAVRADFLARPRVIHPLSADQYDLGSLQAHEWAAVSRHVREVAGAIGTAYEDQHNGFSPWARRSMSLWREMPECLERQSGASALGSLWGVLPADTRSPDHSIWHHLRLTSAMAGAIAGRHGQPDGEAALLLFSLGPVQSFIAAARKTSDLWAGSWILSWLAWSAIEPVAREAGPDAVIFPELFGQPLVDLWLQREVGLGQVLSDLAPRAQLLAQPSLPNRFLAVVPRSTAEALARRSAEAVRAATLRLGRETLEAAVPNGQIPDAVAARVAEQLAEYFELRWIVLPWPQRYAEATDLVRSAYTAGQPDSLCPSLRRRSRLAESGVSFWKSDLSGEAYEELYALAERGLAAAKRAHGFASRDIPPGPRCAQTGELAPVVQGAPLQSGRADATMPVSPHLAKGEQLSAVVLIKRELRRTLGRLVSVDEGEIRRLHFPSTASIASAPYLENLAGTNPADLERLAKALGEDPRAVDRGQSLPWRTHKILLDAGTRSAGYLDARALYAGEGLDAFVDDDGHPLGTAVREAITSLPHAPTPYYMLILGDGDSMGEWLSGASGPCLADVYHGDVFAALPDAAREALAAERRPLSPALHAAVSGALRTFSRDIVPDLIERHCSGKLIYSGGDDVLALVPLRDAATALQGLPAAFSGVAPRGNAPFAVSRGFVKLAGRARLLMGAKASLSAGVVIAHLKEPFHEVLQAAREAERAAKALRRKAAVGISVLKHSGEHLSLCAPWHWDGDQRSTAAMLQIWADAFAVGCDFEGTRVRVSPRFGRSFQIQIAPLVDAVQRSGAEAKRAAAEVFAALLYRHADAMDDDGKRKIAAVRTAVDALVVPTLDFGAAVECAGGAGAAAAIGALLDVAVFLARHGGGKRGRMRESPCGESR